MDRTFIHTNSKLVIVESTLCKNFNISMGETSSILLIVL